MKPLLLLLFLPLCACTTIYQPSGKKLCAIGSNVDGLWIHTREMDVRAAKVDNAIIIQKVGAGVSQGIMSAGGAAVTGGIVK